jgi:hypothetical protein
MAFTTGVPQYIKVAGAAGLVAVTDETDGHLALFLLWFGDETGGGPTALFTSLLTLAVARAMRVEIMHDDASAYIDRVKLFGPA